jgi:large conductance mechanosensitive channel
MSMIKGFKDFITKGSAIDLAVGVVIGAAFTAIVTALVSGLITPLVAAIFGEPNLDNIGNFEINGAKFLIGPILTATINFLLVALAVYFVLIVPINKLRSLAEHIQKKEEDAAAATTATTIPLDVEQVELLKEIRDLLQKK